MRISGRDELKLKFSKKSSHWIFAANQSNLNLSKPILEKVIQMEFLKELWVFLRVRKKLWLAPIIVVMIILGSLLMLAQGSVVAPFYTHSFRS